jgi:hypothetical protein
VFLKKKAERDSKQLFVDYTQQLFNLHDGSSPSSCALTEPGAHDKDEIKMLKHLGK